MKKITFLLFFVSIHIFSQSKLKGVDNIVKSYRDFPSVESLAKQIDNDFNSDIEKARAAYTWITTNLSYNSRNPFMIYDTKIYIVSDEEDYKRRLRKEDEKTALKAFETKNAVCKGYAYLFRKLCDLMEIENKVVLGYIKSSSYEIGYVPDQKNHAWNAIKVDGIWKFIDATQGSGYSYKGVWQPKFNGAYFDIKKEIIRNTHFPQESFWREYTGQKPLKEFSNLPVFSKAYFNSDFQVVSPSSGQIATQKRKLIELKLKGISFNTKIHYKFGDYDRLRKADVIYDNSVFRILIKSPKESSPLKIFLDGQEAVSYMVFVE